MKIQEYQRQLFILWCPRLIKRISLVWHYDGFIRYTYIEQGQTDWLTHFTRIPNSDDCFEPAISWINDGSTLGKLHLLYKKEIDSKWVICRRIFEIDLAEFGSQVTISGQEYDSSAPIIVQDKTSIKRVWYGWIKASDDRSNPDYDNSNSFEAVVYDKSSNAIYLPIFNLAGINNLNLDSSISWTSTPTGLKIQYSKLLGNSFEIFYQLINNNGIAIGTATQIATGQNQTTSISSDKSEWVFYDYLGTIYYRLQKFGMGQVKWDKFLRHIEFQYPPINGSIINIDIAVPIKSLNSRVSELESDKASNEEVLAVLVRNTIESMGLLVPLERIASLKEKLAVEASIETDNRRKVYNYDHVFYDKFFVSRDNENLRPAYCSSLVLKNGSPTEFETCGLEYDDMGKITNNTGQVIKFYSTVYYKENFFTNGFLRLEVHGDLECIETRITSNHSVSPFDNNINWFEISPAGWGQDISLTANAEFVENNQFGIEITLLPGGYIYDWALFLKQGIV